MTIVALHYVAGGAHNPLTHSPAYWSYRDIRSTWEWVGTQCKPSSRWIHYTLIRWTKNALSHYIWLHVFVVSNQLCTADIILFELIYTTLQYLIWNTYLSGILFLQLSRLNSGQIIQITSCKSKISYFYTFWQQKMSTWEYVTFSMNKVYL